MTEQQLKLTIIWCEGRLEELKQEGLVEGESSLTFKGKILFGELKAMHWEPTRDMIVLALNDCDDIEGLADLLVLKQGE